MSKYLDLLANPNARRRYCIELYPYDRVAGAVRAVYLSDDGFVSAPADVPANTWFAPRLTQSIAITRSLWAEGRVGGQSLPSYGLAVLANADHGLDYLAQLDFDGRRVVVLLGGDDFDYADFGVVLDGTVDGLEWGDRTVSVRLRDLQTLLDKPALTTRLGGTGGWDGIAEQTGRALPWALGRVRNAEPVCVDPVNKRYRSSWRAIAAIDRVADMGQPLVIAADYPTLADLDAAVTGGAVLAGQVGICKDQAAFRLVSPPAGLVTCDLRGDAVGGYVETSAGLIRRVLTVAGLTGFDVSAFATLDVAAPAALGLHISEDGATLAGACDQLADAVGAWWGMDRSGAAVVGRLDAPAGEPVAWYGEGEILSYERVATKVPLWRLTLGYQRNWRPMADGDLAAPYRAGGGQATAGAWYREEWRLTAPAADAAVQTRHLLASDERIDTLIDAAADAAAECTRRHGLLKADRDVYRVVVKTQPFARQLGDVVGLRLPRYNLGAGKAFILIGTQEDARTSRVVMEVWG
jgi:hypothetical protein